MAKPAPLLSLPGALLALALALCLLWPMLASEGYLIFPDTKQYIRGGEIIWNMATEMLRGDPGPGGGGGGARLNERGEPYSVRSIAYSLFTLVAGAALWPAGFALLQTAATLWMLFALVPATALERPGALAAGAALIALLSPLPWFAAFLTPDILAAAVLVYGAILMRRFDALTPLQRIALCALACFAVASHYGNMPLAVALFGAILLWRAAARRLTAAVVAAALVPVLVSPLTNLAASSVALGQPSVAPLRLPVLLARSLSDGPARWYLDGACPEARLAICEAFGDDVPDTLSTFLWHEEGIRSLSPAQMARIREEEYLVLWRALLAYPAAQTRSLLGNAALQLVLVGTDQMNPADRAPSGELVQRPPGGRGSAAVRLFDLVAPAAAGAGAAILLFLLAGGRLGREQREILAVIVLGLVLNAAIFGGLSAPVDRYQGRVAWLLPALALIFWAGRRTRPAQDSASRK